MSKPIQLGARIAKSARGPAPSVSLQPFAIGASVLLAVLFAAIVPAARGQAIPAAEASPISTGFVVPVTAGTLNYAVTGSESLTWGYFGNSGATSATTLTGDLGFISTSLRNPFSAVVSGGRSWATGKQPSYSFLSLGLSQVLNAGRWNFVLTDTLSYTPGTSTGGLSGVPGVGDLGANPNPVQVGPPAGQDLLTNYSNRIQNSSSISTGRSFTGKTSFNVTGAYVLTDFLSNGGSAADNGLDSTLVSGEGGVTHQFNPRDALTANYAYSDFTYSGNGSSATVPGFSSQTASLSYTHRFTRKLAMDASAGPQWTRINLSGVTTSTSLFVNAGLSYAGQFSRASAGYVRSTNDGSGVLRGALSDSGTVSAGRIFALVWNCNLFAAFSHTSTLIVPDLPPSTYDTTVVGGQVSRAFAHSLSGFASYTLENQSSQGSVASAADLYSGTTYVLGFGLTYSPRATHFGHS